MINKPLLFKKLFIISEGFSLRTAFKEKFSVLLFKIASHLSDPICRCHEYFRRISVLDHSLFYPLKKMLLSLGVVSHAGLALFTTLPGMAVRSLATSLQKESYIHVQCDHAVDKILPKDSSFTLLSWNVCCIAGGFSISDGGVVPWHYRIDEIAKKIVQEDADVNCLYETFDTTSAFYLSEKLKNSGYAHVYFNIGPTAVGVSSGILIASRYALGDLEFTPFAKETLVGRTKSAEKGVFSFKLMSEGENFAKVYSTHLQHSEEPAFPTEEERLSRKKQMALIMQKIAQDRDICVVVTGDLNLDDEEYENSPWKQHFQKGDRHQGVDWTWGGDEYCARLMGKRVSKPLNLDHVMVVKGSARAIDTSIVPVGYDPTIFTNRALSDHSGLFSTIGLH